MAKCTSIIDLELSEASKIRGVGKHGIYLIDRPANIDLSTPIFRYLRLSSMCDMLTKGELFVPNIQSFTDIRETKGLSKLISSPLSKLQLFREDGSRRSSWELFPCTAISKINDLKKAERIRKSSLVCASCWTKDNRSDGSKMDNYLMWKAYCGNEVGCRIETTIGRLVDSIKSTRSNIVIGAVKYGKVEGLNDYEDHIFHKSIHYEDEQEVRMVVLSNNPKGVVLKVDVEKLINGIKTSPIVHKCVAIKCLNSLREYCKKYPKIAVELSEIKEYPDIDDMSDSERLLSYFS